MTNEQESETREINLRNDNKSIGPKWHPSYYQHRTPQGLTYNGPTYNDKGQSKCSAQRAY